MFLEQAKIIFKTPNDLTPRPFALIIYCTNRCVTIELIEIGVAQLGEL